MIITIATLFPQQFEILFAFSILKRARQSQKVVINIVDIRDFAIDSYKTVDGRPFGGGAGMILRVDVLDRCLKHIREHTIIPNEKTWVILTDARGNPFTQPTAMKYSKMEHVIIIAGHYEGVDERVLPLVDEQISIGPYVLTGGELPAMVITDAIVRLLPEVLKKPDATTDESHKSEGSLEYPQYTKPREYNGMTVPEVLIGGNHAEIVKWKEANRRKK